MTVFPESALVYYEVSLPLRPRLSKSSGQYCLINALKLNYFVYRGVAFDDVNLCGRQLQVPGQQAFYILIGFAFFLRGADADFQLPAQPSDYPGCRSTRDDFYREGYVHDAVPLFGNL